MTGPTVAAARHVISKYHEGCNGRGVPLTDDQLTFNAVITAARQRVEAAVGEINDNHRLFQLAWQGELAPLRDAVHVTVHTTQLAIEMGSVNATPENGYSRYADVCGPWRHDEPRH